MHFSLPDPIRIKLHSKAARIKRARKTRAAWFVLGTAFGIGCSSSLTPITLPHIVELASAPAAAPLASVVALASPAPVAATLTAAEPVVLQPLLAASTPTPTIPAVPELVPVVAKTTPEPVAYPLTKELVVASGDNFVSLLGKAGVSAQEAHKIMEEMGKKFNPRSLGVKDKVTVTLDKIAGAENPTATKISMATSTISTLQITRTAKGSYNVAKVDVPVVKKLARAGGKINSSLYQTIVGSGMPTSMVSEIIKAYSYDVDFQREIHSGDTVDVVFEKTVTEDGKPVGYGKIIYAALDLGDRNLKIYRHTSKDGSSEYYTAKGESVRKALLRTPINGARISSGFGMRSHPILGYSKMHKGVDFAAAMGTPIYASGDGTVSFVGRKGGYGNYLQIKHNTQYGSAYAHLSRFAAGIAPGKKVRQGQVVAYVGSTGASTGPHLHYEIVMNGRQVNPANVKFKTGNSLGGKELAAFKRNNSTLQAQLEGKKPSGKIAMLDVKTKAAAN